MDENDRIIRMTAMLATIDAKHDRGEDIPDGLIDEWLKMQQWELPQEVLLRETFICHEVLEQHLEGELAGARVEEEENEQNLRDDDIASPIVAVRNLVRRPPQPSGGPRMSRRGGFIQVARSHTTEYTSRDDYVYGTPREPRRYPLRNRTPTPVVDHENKDTTPTHTDTPIPNMEQKHDFIWRDTSFVSSAPLSTAFLTRSMETSFNSLTVKREWDRNSLSMLKYGGGICLPTDDTEVWFVKFDPVDGSRLIVGTQPESNDVHLFDLNTGNFWRLMHHNYGDNVTQNAYVFQVVFSCDGEYVLSSGLDGCLNVYNTATSVRTAQLQMEPWTHTSGIGRCLSPSGLELVASFDDAPLHQMEPHHGNGGQEPYEGRALALHPTRPNLVAAATSRRAVCIWDYSVPDQLLSMPPVPGTISGDVANGVSYMSFGKGPSENWIFGGCRRGDVIIGDALRGEWIVVGSDITNSKLYHRHEVLGLAISPDGQDLVTIADDGYLKLHDMRVKGHVATYSTKYSWHLHPPAIEAVGYSSDGLCVHCCGVGSMHVFDKRFNRDPLCTLRHTNDELDPVEGRQVKGMPAAWIPESRRIVTGGDDGAVCIWDVNRHHQPLNRLANRPSGDHAHATYVSCVDVSPDGSMIVSADGARTVALWSASESTVTLGQRERLSGEVVEDEEMEENEDDPVVVLVE